MQWEYKTIRIGIHSGGSVNYWTGCVFNVEKFNNMLNELGRARWELVSCFDARANYDGGVDEQMVAIFKRPMNSN